MPDINGNFNGDRANILPDNTAAFLHLTDQFQRIEQERRMQQRYEQKQEQERNARMQAYIGNAFDPDKFKGADLAQRGINEKLSATMGKMLQIKKNNPNLSDNDLAQMINQEAGGIKSFADKTKEIQGSVGKAVTDITQSDPSLDAGAFADLALHDALFNTDAKGNKTLKDDADINPLTSNEYLANTIKAHKDKVLKPGYATLQNVLKDPKTQEDNTEDVYDPKTGDRLLAGATTKVPYYAQKVVDNKGNVTGVKVKTVPYKLNGQEVRDINGKAVEVIPDEFYNALTQRPSSITAQMETEFEKKYPNVDPNGPMADMLKKQIMTDLVSNHADWTYKPNKDQSPDLKYKLHKERIDDERMRLAEAGNARADKKMDMLVEKQDGAIPRDMYKEIKDQFDKVPNSFGLSLTGLPATTSDLILNYVNGKKKDNEKLNQKDVYLKPIGNGDIQVRRYPVKGTNTLDDKGNKIEDGVGDELLKTLTPADLNDSKTVNPSLKERQVVRKSTYQRVKDGVKAVINKATGKAPSKIAGLDEGALN